MKNLAFIAGATLMFCACTKKQEPPEPSVQIDCNTPMIYTIKLTGLTNSNASIRVNQYYDAANNSKDYTLRLDTAYSIVTTNQSGLGFIFYTDTLVSDFSVECFIKFEGLPQSLLFRHTFEKRDSIQSLSYMTNPNKQNCDKLLMTGKRIVIQY